MNSQDRGRLPSEPFAGLDFIRRQQDPYRIDVPVLTWREANYLNERLPRSLPDVAKPEWLSEEDRQTYGRVYRYFPTYLEAEL